MAVELIGLAYNRNLTNDFWSSLKVADLYSLILEDVYRKRIDYRSMRYHTGQMQLLKEIEELVFQNAEESTVYQLIANRFLKGVESSPFSLGYMEFDYQVIKYFASLATADNFIRSEKLFKAILQLNGQVSLTEQWTFFDLDDYKILYDSLEAFHFQDMNKLSGALNETKDDAVNDVSKWLTHYNEFFHYTYNNQLSPFFYNNTSAIKDWGDLLSRHNDRNKTIVKNTFKFGAQLPMQDPCLDMLKLLKPKEKKTNLKLQEKMKVYKETEYLVEGLDDYDPLVQQKSAESLCDFIYDEEYNDKLIQKFDEVDLPIKKELIRVLGKVMNPKVEGFMLKILDSDESIDIQVLSANELVKGDSHHIAKKLSDKILSGERHFAILLSKLLKTNKYVAIEKHLCDVSSWKQETAYEELAYVLGSCKDVKAKSALAELSQSREDVRTVRNTLYALKRIDPDDDISKLYPKIKVNDPMLDETMEILSH
ncbi:MAG TPA: hypothetical protein PKC21_02310 [Oligoflexia bacterium]|nr:hypothetical protein [Oligoflexia bacterium]HMR24164.1 hypothetical protein [Oligoflexia bacterium]